MNKSIKRCTGCGEDKPLSEFGKDSSAKDGKYYKCKECKSLDNAKSYKKNGRTLTPQQKKRKSERDVIYKRNRRNNDPLFRLGDNISRLIRKSIRIGGYTKKSKTYKILGCSYEDFKEHIESQFQEGMTWENIGRKWHLDHIIPVSSHNNEDELIKLNHYTNFQPLWGEDNMSKGATYIEEEKQSFLQNLIGH